MTHLPCPSLSSWPGFFLCPPPPPPRAVRRGESSSLTAGTAAVLTVVSSEGGVCAVLKKWCSRICTKIEGNLTVFLKELPRGLLKHSTEHNTYPV